ncbi:C-terminal processing protease CtpA/Prc [Clostridium punense]|uniref:C-terminal processing protease CtpA/Prc n=1 Tax=Clostridium punense TaxID=1054297 RepID=A0ABS4K6P5_9CLOT|nr:S41 family peptidase [Clostridium punense]MBP2022816.1 C-terminal processing protease CtpA/Prc [Clostridium punense]
MRSHKEHKKLFLYFQTRNDEFIKELDKFFEDIKKNEITKLVIDVRKNIGGNIKCVEGLLTYFNVKECYFSAAEDEYDKKHVQNIWVDKNRVYLGETYVLISNSTFSAGNQLADIFKFNNIGTLIGEPTGNSPSFYANPILIELPNSKIKCSISTKYIIGVDKNNNSNTVLPDINMSNTIENIMSDKESIIEYIKNL